MDYYKLYQSKKPFGEEEYLFIAVITDGGVKIGEYYLVYRDEKGAYGLKSSFVDYKSYDGPEKAESFIEKNIFSFALTKLNKLRAMEIAANDFKLEDVENLSHIYRHVESAAFKAELYKSKSKALVELVQGRNRRQS